MPSFLIQETFIREYEVESEDIQEAYEMAVNENRPDYTEHSQGVTFIKEVTYESI